MTTNEEHYATAEQVVIAVETSVRALPVPPAVQEALIDITLLGRALSVHGLSSDIEYLPETDTLQLKVHAPAHAPFHDCCGTSLLGDGIEIGMQHRRPFVLQFTPEAITMAWHKSHRFVANDN